MPEASSAPSAPFPGNIEIAQRASMRPIVQLAGERLGIPEERLEPYGHYKAKVSLDYVAQLDSRPDGKLVLVTAISPTPAGEGKTTTTVGLGDALNLLGKRAIVCLREPALGPVFGMKGGAAGGGYSQVVPMEDINLHFTGDFAAIALANNLLAALIDNHIYQGNQLGFDVRRITLRRVVDCADLGAEKFVDIMCRKAGLKPSAAVIVATVRALKYHGGVELADLKHENLAALDKGVVNLERHIDNVHNRYGLPCTVAINRRAEDTEREIQLLIDRIAPHSVRVIPATHFAQGGRGAVELAREVVRLCGEPNGFRFVYEDSATLWDKMKAIATKVYHATDITADTKVRAQIRHLQESGYGHYPVCVAKTQYSFSTDPKLRGAPVHHVVNIREVRLAAGAEFVIMICGEIMTMPGLPKVPAANNIDVSADGRITGLF